MGRKTKPLDQRKTSLFNFNCQDQDLIGRIQIIAKRENKPFGEIIVAALQEYDEKHWDGNFQTVIESYRDGGVKSQGQIEAEIIRELQDNKKVQFKGILDILIKRGIAPRQRKDMAQKIDKKLRQKKVRIEY